jgi:DNA-directed RNA polymerase specialized sigma24 family protein
MPVNLILSTHKIVRIASSVAYLKARFDGLRKAMWKFFGAPDPDVPTAHHLTLPGVHNIHGDDSNVQYRDYLSVIHSLQPDLAAPYKMYLRGFKYHEISEHLDIPIGAVKSRVFQAIQEVQKRLAN